MADWGGCFQVGDQVEISGPWGMIEYTAPGTFVNAKKVAFRLARRHGSRIPVLDVTT